MRNIKFISFLTTCLPLFLSVGCGKIVASNAVVIPTSSLVPTNFSSVSSVSTKVASGYNCPGVPNVVPNMDQTLDGSDYFTVCTSKVVGDYSDILVTGKFSSVNSLCGVPVQMLDQTHFKAKLDIAGNPVYTCSAATAEGVVLANPLANSPAFNAIIIVESPELNNLNNCIIRNFTECPDYSFGKFR